jgi:hypothetical protein
MSHAAAGPAAIDTAQSAGSGAGEQPINRSSCGAIREREAACAGRAVSRVRARDHDARRMVSVVPLAGESRVSGSTAPRDPHT